MLGDFVSEAAFPVAFEISQEVLFSSRGSNSSKEGHSTSLFGQLICVKVFLGGSSSTSGKGFLILLFKFPV